MQTLLAEFRKLVLGSIFLLPTGVVNAQVIADFETPAKTPTLSVQDGSVFSVVANPDTNGNASSNVASYQKVAGNWKAIVMDFAAMQNVGLNDQLKFKIRSSTQGRVFVKLFNGGTLVREEWAPEYNFQPLANVWTECTFNTSAIKNLDFNRIQVNASVDNEAVATVYLDDFKLINSLAPNGEPIIDLAASTHNTETGVAVNFDASGSTDIDGTISSYNWNFGDGTTGTGATTSHTFSTDGIFTVSLVVEDNDGNKSNATVSISVLPVGLKIGTPFFVTTTPKTYEKVEAQVAVQGGYTNFYNPDEIQIDALVTYPDLTVLRVPCFYFEKSKYTSAGDYWSTTNTGGVWMLRFSSAQTGEHKVKFELKDSGGTQTSPESSITISAGTKKGFVKLDPENKQHYRHTSGEPFYPLGINVAWNSTTNYNNIFKVLSQGGANVVRYWQTPFDGQALESKVGNRFYKGLGMYSQEAAAEQDSMINLCEKLGLYMQITIFQHGMFSENVDSNWDLNPYNTAYGGMLSLPEQYFYNANAKAYTKKLLRYIVARWGYSTHLFSWELFNEVQFTGNHPYQTSQWSTAVNTWHDEMGKYIKSLDAFDHFVSTSADDVRLVALDATDGVDNVQYHMYSNSLLATQIAKDKDFRSKVSSVVNGEYGTNVNADVSFDDQRHAIWNGIMTQVPHFMWRWESYTDQTWGDLFKYPAAYVADEDFVSEGNLSDWVFTAKNGTTAITSTGFHSDENYYGYVYDPANKNNLNGVVCDAPTMQAGEYSFKYYNIITGVVTEADVTISSEKKITMPNFNKAIAFKAHLETAVITGAEEDLLHTVKVYPNPAHSFINIESDNVIRNILVHDIQGIANYQAPVNDTHIQLTTSKLKSGLYIIRVQTDREVVVRTISIQ